MKINDVQKDYKTETKKDTTIVFSEILAKIAEDLNWAENRCTLQIKKTR